MHFLRFKVQGSRFKIQGSGYSSRYFQIYIGVNLKIWALIWYGEKFPKPVTKELEKNCTRFECARENRQVKVRLHSQHVVPWGGLCRQDMHIYMIHVCVQHACSPPLLVLQQVYLFDSSASRYFWARTSTEVRV